MSTQIFYYTGTGNSLWITRQLAQRLDEVEVLSISSFPDESLPTADRIGLVFPVHIWGLPHKIIGFIDRCFTDPHKYYFALAVNGGQVAATLLQMAKLLKSRGLSLSAGFDFVMPSNYIPWGGPGPKQKQTERFEEALKKLDRCAASISRKEVLPVEKGPLWQNILFTWLYKLSFKQVPRMDRRFWVDERCNGCGTCAEVCGAKNIRMENGKPVWLNQCEQCLACIQWCPLEALQYGKKTPQYQRYHHPEISLKDILTAKEKN